MKYIGKTSIQNIEDTALFDEIFVFPKASSFTTDSKIEIIYMQDLLSKKKNKDLESKLGEKPAMYSNMYSSQDELEIFESLYNDAIDSEKKIHIVGITLEKELKILEDYYETLGFMREDINCFRVDFSVPLVTVSINIENLMWKGSDYKAQREKIFFIPPVRESSQNKALFKGINRGVVAGIHIPTFGDTQKEFLAECIRQEKVLPLTMGKVLFYNLDDMGIVGESEELKIQY